MYLTNRGDHFQYIQKLNHILSTWNKYKVIMSIIPQKKLGGEWFRRGKNIGQVMQQRSLVHFQTHFLLFPQHFQIAFPGLPGRLVWLNSSWSATPNPRAHQFLMHDRYQQCIFIINPAGFGFAICNFNVEWRWYGQDGLGLLVLAMRLCALIKQVSLCISNHVR